MLIGWVRVLRGILQLVSPCPRPDVAPAPGPPDCARRPHTSPGAAGRGGVCVRENEFEKGGVVVVRESWRV